MGVLDPFFLHIRSWCRSTLHVWSFWCCVWHI